MMPRLWLFTGLGLLLVVGAIGFAWRQGGAGGPLPPSASSGSSSLVSSTAKPPRPPAPNVPDMTNVSDPAGEAGGEEQPPPGPVSALPPGGLPERPPHAHDWPDEAILKKQQAGK